jgi:hypothetical protein
MPKNARCISAMLMTCGIPLIVHSGVAFSGDSCNALLALGLYNVTQSSSAAEGQAMALSTFCSYDYSSSSTSSATKAGIKASFIGIFGGSASGSYSDSEIVTAQHQLCTSGYNSSAYSNQASAYARTVYQGTLDAWNQCQALSLRGLNFDVRTSSTLQGVTIIIKPATGVSARFSGLYQDGLGDSVCKRTLPPASGSTVGTAVAVNETTSFSFSAAQPVTINCKRTMQQDADDNYFADAQDLIVVTSADSLRIPLAAIGSLARATIEQVTAQIAEHTTAQIAEHTSTSTILCRKTNNPFTGGPGGYTVNFAASDCGGNLPNQSYKGVMKTFNICGVIANPGVNDSPVPGVGFWSVNGVCGHYTVEALYVKVR